MRFAAILLIILHSPPVHVGWSTRTQLPSAVTNNAVASDVNKDRTLIYSFMGMGKGLTYTDISTTALVFDSRSDEWLLLPPVPGKIGRIAATAVIVAGQAYLIGGYTVGRDGKETTVADVDIYTHGPEGPAQGYWAKGVPVPVPVADSVAGVVEDRYILLISGWSKDDNVANVQIYDTWKDHWLRGNVISGTPVSGHAGVIVNKTIIYCGGARKNPDYKGDARVQKFIPSDECWQGRITSTNPFKFEWNQLPPHPGKAQYGMAAGAWGKKAVFSGGTINPHNYNGTGYGGEELSPSAATFAWNTENNTWETLPDNPEPTMDSRVLVPDRDGLVIVGGMQAGQKVVKHVAHLALQK